MPYAGATVDQSQRIDRCVTRVMRQGHDKSSAIAICHASIVKRKERREARMLALKANYGAKVGQTIAGALSRGPGGKFTRGDGSAASGRETIDALIKGGKKGGKGKKKVSEGEQAATGEKAGIDSEDLAAVRVLSKAGAVSEGDANRLVNLGLAERGTDGTLRMASNARSLLRAVQGGDVQAAKDALSKGRDKVSKATEADAKRAAAAGKKASSASSAAGKKAAADAKRAEAEKKREAQRAQREQARTSAEMQKATDRVEEVEALIGSDKNVTDVERTRRLNQLDALDQRIEAAGGNDELTKRVATLRKRLSGASDAPSDAAKPEPTKRTIQPIPLPSAQKEARDRFTVFKQGNKWRWLAITSNAYQDGDREIVTQRALEADAERMTESGEYGPLRFWHVGKVVYDKPLDWQTARAGVGLDIGTCDFSVVHGRMAIEGGTVKEMFAPGLAASDWQVSRGFAHPITEPSERAYHNIRTFERSPLPVGKASNPFTSFSIQEGDNMANLTDKMKEFAQKFFNGDEAAAAKYAADLTQKDKEIEAAGVAFKAEGETVATETAPEATTEAKAEGEGGVFVGDMLADEFAALLTKSISDALAPMLTVQAEQGKAIEAVEIATKEAREVAAKAGQLLVTQKQTSDASITALDARVKELEGDAPGQKGYRATTDAGTITQKQMAAPQAPDDLARMAALMFGQADAHPLGGASGTSA